MREQYRKQDLLRRLPSVNAVLKMMSSLEIIYGHRALAKAAQRAIDRVRRSILDGESNSEVSTEDVLRLTRELLRTDFTPRLRPVINATGTVLHTNLGRSVLPPEAVRAVCRAAESYVNLELDLETGQRSHRVRVVEDLICEVTGAEAATVVNNNAGAVLLALDSLAHNKEVIISRSQIVEIGGGFRLPEIMKKSGARLVEVGTTNRTYESDYEAAISPETAMILQVHRSNFALTGYVADVPLEELVRLGHSHGLVVMQDLGSGTLIDLGQFGLNGEPTVQDTLKTGVDIVTFSGDKLLGGPQAGIIVGSKKLINLINQNPLSRALRVDKLTLAGLEATLRIYFGDSVTDKIPTLKFLTEPLEKVSSRAELIAKEICKSVGTQFVVSLENGSSQVGGGAFPALEILTKIVRLQPADVSRGPRISIEEIVNKLRNRETPVFVRVQENSILLDARTIFPDQIKTLVKALQEAVFSAAGNTSC